MVAEGLLLGAEVSPKVSVSGPPAKSSGLASPIVGASLGEVWQLRGCSGPEACTPQVAPTEGRAPTEREREGSSGYWAEASEGLLQPREPPREVGGAAPGEEVERASVTLCRKVGNGRGGCATW